MFKMLNHLCWPRNIKFPIDAFTVVFMTHFICTQVVSKCPRECYAMSSDIYLQRSKKVPSSFAWHVFHVSIYCRSFFHQPAFESSRNVQGSRPSHRRYLCGPFPKLRIPQRIRGGKRWEYKLVQYFTFNSGLPSCSRQFHHWREWDTSRGPSLRWYHPRR